MFRTRINELFKERNCSVVAFADEIGITRQSLAYYLAGDRLPDYSCLKKICQSLNVSADWLLGLSDIRSRDPDYEKKLSDASTHLKILAGQTFQFLQDVRNTIAKIEQV